MKTSKRMQLLTGLLLFGLFILSQTVRAQTDSLYSAAYGEKDNPVIVFLHGGPGYNSYSFEASAAPVLTEKGYRVIVFDQRGSGRSSEVKGEYTFEEAFGDLNAIYKKYGIEKATLIGHSWGGTLGIMYAAEYPGKTENLILTDSPLSYQMTYKTILKRCRKIYANDSSQLKFIEKLAEMDSTSLPYSSYCFMQAMKCGFYKPEKPTEEAKQLYAQLKEGENAGLNGKMTIEPVSGYYKNEQYTTLNLSEKLKAVVEKTPVYGIYGKDDGLFDREHFDALQSIIGKENFTIVDRASHSVFIDRREKFVELMEKYME